MAQIIPLKGRARDADTQARSPAQRSELVIFPGVNLGMLREVVRENKDKKAAAKPKPAREDQA